MHGAYMVCISGACITCHAHMPCTHAMHMPAWIFCLSGLMTSVPPLSSPPSVANVHCDCTAECTSEEASGPPASRQIATGKHATLGSYLKSSAEYIDMSSAFSGLDGQR